MSKFEDHLWAEFVRERGDALAQAGRPAAKRSRRVRPRLVAGTSLSLAGIVTAVVLVLSATSTSPAFAVIRNHDGTLTISIQRATGIAGANARLHQLGIRASVMQQAPSGCRTYSVPMGGNGAPAAPTATPSGSGHPSDAHADWRIDPRQVPVGHRLVLTPPPAPKSGSTGISGQVWSCPEHSAVATPVAGAGKSASAGSASVATPATKKATQSPATRDHGNRVGGGNH